MDEKISPKLLYNPICFIALVGGAGLFRRAPGTLSSIVGLVIYWFVLSHFPIRAYVAVILISCIIGIAVCHYAAEKIGKHDHSGIGWDEVVGMWVTMTAVTDEMMWLWVMVGFVLFRLFDIYKPYPISYIDRHLKGGLGIMLDDIVAGVLSCVSLHLLILVFNYIG
jgi:phosphatidylglycerophosphatase A